jgi:hypothetical protein
MFTTQVIELMAMFRNEPNLVDKSKELPGFQAHCKRLIEEFGEPPPPPKFLTPPPDTRPSGERTIGKSLTPERDPYFEHGLKRSPRIASVRKRKASDSLDRLLPASVSNTDKISRPTKIHKAKKSATTIVPRVTFCESVSTA